MKNKVLNTAIAIATFKPTPRGSVSRVIGSVMLTVLFGAVFVAGLNKSTLDGSILFGALTALFGYGLYRDLTPATTTGAARND